MLRNTKDSYGTVAITLHWIIAIMISSLVSVGLYMVDLPANDNKWYIYGIHKAIGVLLLTLVVLRAIYRLSNVQPTLPEKIPSFQINIAKINVFALYVMMFIMPLSGLFGSLTAGHDVSLFGLVNIPAFADQYKAFAKWCWFTHETCTYLLIASILLHICGALYHHFVLKDNVLRRIIKGS